MEIQVTNVLPRFIEILSSQIAGWSNFAIQSNKENVNILKNGFYHRVPQASEYGKSECSKIF